MANWRPGELDQRIEFQRETNNQNDGMGGQEIGLTTLYETWAKVVPRNGNERFFSDQVQARADYMFVIRNRTDILLEENDRILYENEEYNISYITKQGGRKLYTEVFAIRGVAQ